MLAWMKITRNDCGWHLFAAIVATIAFSVYITEYQYGGDSYYMKIDTQPTVSSVEVPVGISIQGYTYQGTAKNAQGKQRVSS